MMLPADGPKMYYKDTIAKPFTTAVVESKP